MEVLSLSSVVKALRPKRIEDRGTVAEYLFSHRSVSRAMNSFEGAGGPLCPGEWEGTTSGVRQLELRSEPRRNCWCS